MVIQCSSCETRFKIADDKVKAGGVKVRCSKCKEVFTVQPPEEEQTESAATTNTEETSAPEPSSGDWGDMNATFSGETSEGNSDVPSPDLNDIDWDSLNSEVPATASEEPEDPAASISIDDFSFGDDDEGEETAAETDDFSFGEDEAGVDIADEETDDVFSFGGEAENDSNLDTEEPLGEGANDEFSFDEEPTIAGGADDFDWDGDSSVDTSDDDDDGFGFGEESQEKDSLDFSSLEMSEDEEPAVEVEEPATQERPPAAESTQPASIKGPQKGGTRGSGSKRRRKPKKKSGLLRGIVSLIFLLGLILGGGLFGLNQLGFWSGNIEELQSVDYAGAGQAAWQKAVEQYNKLIGNEAALEPAGSITVTEMSGKYIKNAAGAMLFVIEGKVRNDFTSYRSHIEVKGILYDAASSPVQQQKVFCGNVFDSETIKTWSIEKLQERARKKFGDSFSNLDVAPGTILPFTIFFDKLPTDLKEYNVEYVGSVAGTKQ